MRARERILGRLRATALPRPPEPPEVASWYAGRQRNETRPQQIERLRSALEAARAEVHDARDAAWPAIVKGLAEAKGVRRLLAGSGSPDAARLAQALPAGIELVCFDRPIDDWRDELFDTIDAGLSRAKGAIAETGSLILWPDAHEPRTVSLVPPIHFVLVDVGTLHPDFHTAMQAGRWAENLPTNALLVSGPSKTADIQQTLAYGAHGPRELIVLLIDEEGAGK